MDPSSHKDVVKSTEVTHETAPLVPGKNDGQVRTLGMLFADYLHAGSSNKIVPETENTTPAVDPIMDHPKLRQAKETLDDIVEGARGSDKLFSGHKMHSEDCEEIQNCEATKNIRVDQENYLKTLADTYCEHEYIDEACGSCQREVKLGLLKQLEQRRDDALEFKTKLLKYIKFTSMTLRAHGKDRMELIGWADRLMKSIKHYRNFEKMYSKFAVAITQRFGELQTISTHHTTLRKRMHSTEKELKIQKSKAEVIDAMMEDLLAKHNSEVKTVVSEASSLVQEDLSKMPLEAITKLVEEKASELEAILVELRLGRDLELDE